MAVQTFDNPLRGPTYDSARLEEQLATIGGAVVLVGHPYGGAVITNTDDPDVVANVYIAAFAQDVDDATAADMFAHQKSAALVANLEPSGDPSWAKVPSWYLVSQRDQVIPPALHRFIASRAAAGHTTEVDASHASLVSRPGEVATTIQTAATATQR